jgi:hypothetical protein
MAIAGTPALSLRPEQAETSRLTWAFVFSLALHLTIAGLYYVGHEFGWWKSLHWPEWFKSSKMLTELLEKPQLPTEERQIEVPLVFVEVTQEQATPEEPKKTPYYSDKNSVAASPKPKEEDVPKIDGKQTDMVKTEDVPRTKAFPLNPTPPNPPPDEIDKEEHPETKFKPDYTPGALVLAKPAEKERKDEGESDEIRPRTIKEARARLPAGAQLPGPKMKQDGGVHHPGKVRLDVQGSPFGDYDARLIYAVQRCWDDLLESRQFAGEQTGKVTIRFRLYSDGTIQQVTETESTVDSVLTLLCRMAIEHPAPYDAWPSEMRHKIAENYRELTFTFLYY